MTGFLIDALIWLNGAAVGAIVAGVYLWWSIHTGRRNVRGMRRE